MRKRKSLRDTLKEEGMKMVPLKSLKRINPVAVQIKNRLGKGYKVYTVIGTERGDIKRLGVDTTICPKIPGKKNTLVNAAFLLRVERDPGRKEIGVQVFSQHGGVKHKTVDIVRAKKIVEEVLEGRGIRFTKHRQGDHTVYKIGKKRDFYMDYHR